MDSGSDSDGSMDVQTGAGEQSSRLVEVGADLDKSLPGSTSTSNVTGENTEFVQCIGSSSGPQTASSRCLPSGACPSSLESFLRESKGRVSVDRSNDPLVYKLTNVINGKWYVGKSVSSFQRMCEHASGKKEMGNGKLQVVDMAIQKYGACNFMVEWLETNIDYPMLLEREGYWMKLHGTMSPHGYNVLPPGETVGGPLAVAMLTAAKRKVREEKLALMDDQRAAAELRDQLDMMSNRQKLIRDGKDPGPDRRFGMNAKRRATWAEKREAKWAKLPPMERKAAIHRWEQKIKSQRKTVTPDVVHQRNNSSSRVQYMKEYRQKNQGVHLPKSTYRGDERMISCNQAEAAGLDLVDLRARTGRDVSDVCDAACR